MMSKEEFMALCRLVNYVKESEYISFQEHLDVMGGEEEGHIYHDAKIISDYINGLLSMGCEPK